MKLALTVWEDRISPVADSARKLLVVNVGSQSIHSREVEHFNNESLFYRARKLADLDIKTLICGAISDFYASLVEGYGIRLIPHIRGQVEEVLDAYVDKSLSNPRFAMIGSSNRKRTDDETKGKVL